MFYLTLYAFMRACPRAHLTENVCIFIYTFVKAYIYAVAAVIYMLHTFCILSVTNLRQYI